MHNNTFRQHLTLKFVITYSHQENTFHEMLWEYFVKNIIRNDDKIRQEETDAEMQQSENNLNKKALLME
jgi:hypothetical protein